MFYKNTAALITAAGLSSRMGDFKPLLSLGGSSIVRRVIAALRRGGAEEIVLITGYRAAELEAHVAAEGVVCLRNERYAETQMFDSARLGFAYLYGRCDALLFTPADVPLFSADTVAALRGCEADWAVPRCGGKSGHPMLLSASLLPGLLADCGEGGLRGALSRCGAVRTEVDVPDAGILLDADTPEDYRLLLSLQAERDK